jgi:hypothetical protein
MPDWFTWKPSRFEEPEPAPAPARTFKPVSRQAAEPEDWESVAARRLIEPQRGVLGRAWEWGTTPFRAVTEEAPRVEARRKQTEAALSRIAPGAAGLGGFAKAASYLDPSYLGFKIGEAGLGTPFAFGSTAATLGAAGLARIPLTAAARIAGPPVRGLARAISGVDAAAGGARAVGGAQELYRTGGETGYGEVLGGGLQAAFGGWGASTGGVPRPAPIPKTAPPVPGIARPGMRLPGRPESIAALPERVPIRTTAAAPLRLPGPIAALPERAPIIGRTAAAAPEIIPPSRRLPGPRPIVPEEPQIPPRFIGAEKGGVARTDIRTFYDPETGAYFPEAAPPSGLVQPEQLQYPLPAQQFYQQPAFQEAVRSRLIEVPPEVPLLQQAGRPSPIRVGGRFQRVGQIVPTTETGVGAPTTITMRGQPRITAPIREQVGPVPEVGVIPRRRIAPEEARRYWREGITPTAVAPPEIQITPRRRIAPEESKKYWREQVASSPEVATTAQRLEEVAPTPASPMEKINWMREIYNLPRGVVTTLDFSAPFRQGFPLIHRKEWRNAIPSMFKAAWKEENFNRIMDDIQRKPLFQLGMDPDTGKALPSFAQRAGLNLSDLVSLGGREEATISRLAEKIPIFGPLARGSNRAYTAYLNKLRADTFESLVDDAAKSGLDPMNNEKLAKGFADYVNTATGRGPLRFDYPTAGKEGIKWQEANLEKNLGLFNATLFSPRLIAARMRMLNPATYLAAEPAVRKEYLKSALSTAGAWMTVAGLAKLAGAEVGTDSNSADFMKVKVGNTRLDPGGGFQQFLVAASRLASGKTTSSTTGKTTELGRGYRAPTEKDVVEQFITGRMHPFLKFAYDIGSSSDYKPTHLGDRTLQLFTPLIIQDAVELAKEDPRLLPMLGPAAFGMGTQTYEQGKFRKGGIREKPFLIPEEYDIRRPSRPQFTPVR